MKRWFSRWYWRYRIELLIGRLGYVPLREYRKLQDEYMRLAADYPRTPRTVEFDAIPWLDEQRRQILVSADYKRGIPCS